MCSPIPERSLSPFSEEVMLYSSTQNQETRPREYVVSPLVLSWHTIGRKTLQDIILESMIKNVFQKIESNKIASNSNFWIWDKYVNVYQYAYSFFNHSLLKVDYETPVETLNQQEVSTHFECIASKIYQSFWKVLDLEYPFKFLVEARNNLYRAYSFFYHADFKELHITADQLALKHLIHDISEEELQTVRDYWHLVCSGQRGYLIHVNLLSELEDFFKDMGRLGKHFNRAKSSSMELVQNCPYQFAKAVILAMDCQSKEKMCTLTEESESPTLSPRNKILVKYKILQVLLLNPVYLHRCSHSALSQIAKRCNSDYVKQEIYSLIFQIEDGNCVVGKYKQDFDNLLYQSSILKGKDYEQSYYFFENLLYGLSNKIQSLQFIQY